MPIGLHSQGKFQNGETSVGKYSEEKDIEISKADVAKIQLEDAIDLFLAGKRISAITLAGAADGIFEDLLKQRKIKSSAEEVWENIIEIREKTGLHYADNRTRSNAFVEWNKNRNRLKHHDGRDGDWLAFSVFDDAYHSIRRANADGDKLGIVAHNCQEFENWLIENIYM